MTTKQALWGTVVIFCTGAAFGHLLGSWFIGLAYVILIINLFVILLELVNTLIKDDDEEEDESY